MIRHNIISYRGFQKNFTIHDQASHATLLIKLHLGLSKEDSPRHYEKTDRGRESTVRRGCNVNNINCNSLPSIESSRKNAFPSPSRFPPMAMLIWPKPPQTAHHRYSAQSSKTPVETPFCHFCLASSYPPAQCAVISHQLRASFIKPYNRQTLSYCETSGGYLYSFTSDSHHRFTVQHQGQGVR